MQVRVTMVGNRPLLMHNVRLASPMDPYAKKLGALNRAKPSSKRTDEDRMDIARVEWEGGLYHHDTLGPYVPMSWAFKTLLEGARTGKRGQKVESGLVIVNMENPLLYKGPRDIEGMWGNGESEFVDFRTVRVGQAKVDRCRPIFRDWSVDIDVLLDTSILDIDELADIADIAGRLKGVGDYRQQFGRYTASVEKI